MKEYSMITKEEKLLIFSPKLTKLLGRKNGYCSALTYKDGNGRKDRKMRIVHFEAEIFVKADSEAEATSKVLAALK